MGVGRSSPPEFSDCPVCGPCHPGLLALGHRAQPFAVGADEEEDPGCPPLPALASVEPVAEMGDRLDRVDELLASA